MLPYKPLFLLAPLHSGSSGLQNACSAGPSAYNSLPFFAGQPTAYTYGTSACEMTQLVLPALSPRELAVGVSALMICPELPGPYCWGPMDSSTDTTLVSQLTQQFSA